MNSLWPAPQVPPPAGVVPHLVLPAVAILTAALKPAVPALPPVDPELLLSAQDRADRNAYPSVFSVLAKGSKLGPDAQGHRSAQQRAAAQIPNWSTFRRLAGADLRYVWASAEGDRNSAVQNRKKTWKSLFRRFAKLCGFAGVLDFKRTAPGFYLPFYEEVQISNASRWGRFVDAAEQIGVRENIIEMIKRQFELDCKAAEAQAAKQGTKPGIQQKPKPRAKQQAKRPPK